MKGRRKAGTRVALGVALTLALGLAGCGHRELTAPCGPLAFAPGPRPPEPFAALRADACGEARPVNAPLSARP